MQENALVCQQRVKIADTRRVGLQISTVHPLFAISAHPFDSTYSHDIANHLHRFFDAGQEILATF